MTPAQLEAIAALQLTPDDLQSWVEEQGLNIGMGMGGDQGSSPDAQATRRAGFAGGEDMSPEMAARRAEFQDMSEEQREVFRTTAQAGGGSVGPGRGAGMGSRQPVFLIDR